MMPYSLPPDAREISTPNKNLAVRFLNDRLTISIWTLKDINDEIQGRIEFKNGLVEYIEESICDLVSRLYQLEPRHSTDRENEIIGQLVKLEREKRDRETEMWRDIAVLKHEFRIAYKDFRKILGRIKIITGEAG